MYMVDDICFNGIWQWLQHKALNHTDNTLWWFRGGLYTTFVIPMCVRSWLVCKSYPEKYIFMLSNSLRYFDRGS